MFGNTFRRINIQEHLHFLVWCVKTPRGGGDAVCSTMCQLWFLSRWSISCSRASSSSWLVFEINNWWSVTSRLACWLIKLIKLMTAVSECCPACWADVLNRMKRSDGTDNAAPDRSSRSQLINHQLRQKQTAERDSKEQRRRDIHHISDYNLNIRLHVNAASTSWRL